MADILLDITVIQDGLAGNEAALDILRQVMNQSITASVSPITIVELWSDTNIDRKSEIRYTGIINFLKEAPLTLDACKIAGLWLASLNDVKERQHYEHFALIAASAKERDEPICTRNTEDYSKFHVDTIAYSSLTNL